MQVRNRFWGINRNFGNIGTKYDFCLSKTLLKDGGVRDIKTVVCIFYATRMYRRDKEVTKIPS